MGSVSLTTLAHDHLNLARTASSGRSSHTVYGGQGHRLRQTLIALVAGRMLDEHENPGEATIQVLAGEVLVQGQQESWHGTSGDLLVVPDERHTLEASADSVVLLTVALQS